MYRRGLLMTLISQVIGTVILFAILTMWDLYLFDLISDLSNDSEVIGDSTLALIYDAGLVLFSIFGFFNFVGLICSSFALNNLNAAAKGMEPLNKALAQATGVLGLFSNAIGAILIFKNMNSEVARFSRNSRNRTPSIEEQDYKNNK